MININADFLKLEIWDLGSISRHGVKVEQKKRCFCLLGVVNDPQKYTGLSLS